MYDEEGSLLGEYGMGGAQSAGQSQYLYLPTSQGPIPIAAEIDNRLYAIHTDHLGTPRRLTQADGQAAWQWAYSAYGDEAPTLGAKRFTNETTNPTTGATNIPPVRFNLRYPGQYFDEESGLHYNYFRSYDPRTGRYTQTDPIGLDGGWNRFAYVKGNPLSFTDARGLAPDTCSGPDCVTPPYDPTPDGPKPGPQPSPDKDRGKNSASEQLCEPYEKSKIKKKICEVCVDWACKGTFSALCCMEAHRQCVIKAANGEGDQSKCAAKLMICNAYGGRGSK